MIKQSAFCLVFLSMTATGLYGKCASCTRKQEAPAPAKITKNAKNSAIAELSKNAIFLEKEWKNLDLKISHLSRQSVSISGEINAQNNAISQNMAKMISGNSDHENVIISNCTKITNNRFKKLTNRCQQLKQVREEIKDLKSKQTDVLTQLESAHFSIKDKSRTKFTGNKLTADTITDIAKHASDIPDLLARIDLEISAGAFKSFAKCDAPSPHIYPVEPLLIEKKVSQSNDKRFKFIDIDVSCRPGSFVFAPMFGTIVFCENLPKYGDTVVIRNSNAYTVITGLSDKYFTVGNIVQKNQVIGTLKKSEGVYSKTNYVIRVKSKKKIR